MRARLLDDGLDEMAARTYQGLPVRLAVTVVAAGLAGLLLPWRICLIWLLTQGLSEALGVLVSRPQAKGVAGDLGLRTGHLVSVAVGCCIWMSLGGMLWISGAAAGAVCAVILWLSVVFFAHSNAYQSIGGFFVGGALPALGLMLFLIFGPNPLGLPLAPILGLMAVALVFFTDGVLRSVSTRDRLIVARRKLTEADAQYRLLADNSTDIIVRYGPGSVIEFVSPSIRLLGYEPEDLLGHTADEFIHPEDNAFSRKRRGDLLQGRIPKRDGMLAVRMRRADGGWTWMQGNPSPIHGPGGEVLGVITSLRDISAHIAAVDALTESEARYRVLAEASRDAVLRFDLQGQILYASPSSRFFGYEPEDLIERNAFSLVHPEDVEGARERVAAVLDPNGPGGLTRSSEFRVRTPSGDYVWVEGNPSATRDDDGNPTGFTDSFRDISKRKAVQMELAANEARYRMLADNSTDIIVQSDPQGFVLYISPAVRQLGYTAEEVVGRRLFDFVHPEDREWAQTLRRELLDNAPSRPGLRREYRVRRKDGDYVCLESNPSVIHGETGEIVGSVNLLRDITQRRAMEDELRRKSAEAEAATEAKSQFLANMSHEIRTPLTGVIGFAGLLKSASDLSPEAALFAQRIVTSSQTLLEVVNDILDFSKLDSGQIELDPQPFDPAEFVIETVELVRAQAEQKGLILQARLSGTLPDAVIADRGRLRQVLLNLLTNAIKFTDQGGVTVAVTYGEPSGAILRFEVIDTGRGIGGDEVGRLFQRFSQIDGSSTRQHGGSGLGLAICKSLTELMGGAIGVESKAGAGSLFWFTLPAPPAQRVEPVAIPASPAYDGRRARILVVDDVAVNRELVRAMLSAVGHDISEASSGLEAIAAALHTAFDLILMDLQMPGVDGIAAAQAIRAQAGTNQRTPILALSANVLPNHVETCLKAGMEDHIAKPIDPAELLSKVGRWTAQPGNAVP